VPVVGLPELDTSGYSIAALLAPGANPVPPAPIGVSSGGPPRPERNTSIDNWFLERLFGSRR
jgi:hypothetical protein